MFDCLAEFIKEIREKSTKHMDEVQKSDWIWDGNVPTSYTTPCGKALGRWITNQRSAKAKGTLKDDREVRLVSTGLKWSASYSWRQMLCELEIYVHEQMKDGAWNGNVPTNYKIKSSTAPCPEDDSKNLGRWVNKQRSLFHAGKLKKERQRDLKRTGLKWGAKIGRNTWKSMFCKLEIYVHEQMKDGAWNGKVPTDYKIKSSTAPCLEDDNKNLGRWVNRQRRLFHAGKLKKERQRDLERIGLKWSVLLTTSRSTMSVGESKKKVAPKAKSKKVAPKAKSKKVAPKAKSKKVAPRAKSKKVAPRAKSRIKESGNETKEQLIDEFIVQRCIPISKSQKIDEFIARRMAQSRVGGLGVSRCLPVF